MKRFLFLSIFFLTLFVSTPTTIYAQITLDPHNPGARPNPSSLIEQNITEVRLVLKNDSTTINYVNELKNAGVNVIGIVNWEYSNQAWTNGGSLDNNYINNYSNILTDAYNTFGNLNAYQIWNEPDGVAGTIPLDPQSYGALLAAANNTLQNLNSSQAVISAGFVSGNINYIQEMMDSLGGIFPADGVAYHPYVDPSQPGAINNIINGIMALSNLTGRPVWITEFGWETSDQQAQAAWLGAVFSLLENPQTKPYLQTVMWYAYSDAQKPGFGLLNADGSFKESFLLFLEILLGHPIPPDLLQNLIDLLVPIPVLSPTPPTITQPTLSCPSDDQGTLRPKAYSASCKIQKVPDKVTAKVEKFWVKTKITMKIDDAMTNLCNGTYYPQVTWNAQVGIDLSKTYYPQAGFGKSYTTNNPEAEYLADYITGSLFGDGEVPVLPKAWDNAGIFRKISTGWYEDEKKCDLTKIKNADYPVKLNILMGLTSYNQNLKNISCPPLEKPITDISWTIWRTANFIDSALWDAITNFTHQDTPGDILITSTEPPSQITTADQGSKQEASNKIRSALSVPHAQRTVDSARELVKILAPAGLENLNTKPKNPFANSKKDYSSEVASMDSSDGEIFRIITTKLSSLYIQAKNKIIAFAQSKNLLAQIPTTPGNACLGPNGQDGGMNMIINEENGGIQIHAWNTQPPECGDPSDYEFHVRYLWDGAEIGGCDEYKGGGGYLPRYNPNGTPEERYGLWINGMSNGNCAVPESEIKNRNGGSISGWKDHLTVQYWISNSHGIDNIPGCSKTRACNCPAGDPNCFAPPKPPTPPPPPPCGLSFNKSQVTIKGDVDKKEPNKLNNVRKDPIIIEVNSPDSPPISGLSQNEANKIKAACDACIASGQSGCKCSVTLDYGTIIELEAAFPYNKTIWENFAKERESGFLNYFIPQGTGEGFKSDDNSSKIGYILYSLTAAKSTKDSTLEIIGGDSGTDIEGKIESGLYLFGAQKAKQCVSQRLFLPSFAGQPVECPNLL